jgi:hypothetical protein
MPRERTLETLDLQNIDADHEASVPGGDAPAQRRNPYSTVTVLARFRG